MKSIMQEASSIAKAIEQAWMTAGQPAEFTIKVLEEPQKNFIGFTTRSAKIALFFEMAPSAKPQAPKAKPAVSRHTEAKVMQPKPVIQEREQKEPVAPRQAHPTRRQYKPYWNDAMVNFTKEWLQETLSLMGIGNVPFTIEPSDFYLRVTFGQSLIGEEAQEKRLFASLATLIIETLKRTFKTGLRGHKIVLIPAAHDSQS